MGYQVPKKYRPEGVYHRKVSPGLDIPAAFLDELKAIDTRLHIVWHPFKVEFDPVMNTYEGKLDDPRFTIHCDEGTNQEVWGWVLRNPDNSPIRENLWHIWQIHQYGWSHVTSILSTDPRYLTLLARRLYLQGRFTDKYGAKAYTRNVRNMQAEEKERQKKDLEEMNMAVQQENSWLLRRAMDNLGRGVVAATRPQKDIIMSYGGQGNKSRIIRDITDKEGGIKGYGDL